MYSCKKKFSRHGGNSKVKSVQYSNRTHVKHYFKNKALNVL